MPPMTRSLAAVLIGLVWPAVELTTLRAAEPTKPNVLLVLADDLGSSDLGCFGGEIATPNLDRLASQGVRFTQMYTMARCCPSRGEHPHRAISAQGGRRPYGRGLGPTRLSRQAVGRRCDPRGGP